MKYIYLIVVSFLLLFTLGTNRVLAAGSCQNIYNGGTVCNQTNGTLSIQKSVLNPLNMQYTNNLRQDQYVFLRGQTINFQIKLTNTSKSNVSNIIITDNLPANLDFFGGDGTFDNRKHTLTIKLSQLAANSGQTYNFQARVNNRAVHGGQVDACILNTVSVSTTSFLFFTNMQGQTSASFCISSQQRQAPLPTSTKTSKLNPTPTSLSFIGESNVYSAPKAKQSPPTGPNELSLLILPLFAFLGKKLQKKA